MIFIIYDNLVIVVLMCELASSSTSLKKQTKTRLESTKAFPDEAIGMH